MSVQERLRRGGLAAWSIRRPISVVMLALAVVVVGLLSLERLGIDLLPHIIYPEVRARINDPGVPARIIEDQITRQLEEQLAITENAISIQSYSREGRSSVNLSFPYGTDIDTALRDASTRMDRAKRFLPDTIEAPTIYKRDPMQIPILELAVSSSRRDAVDLRDWVDYQFSNWFLNLPGVASTEVGGGIVREIQLLLDQKRMADYGISFSELSNTIQTENRQYSGGRINFSARELSSRVNGRFKSLQELAQLPLESQKTALDNQQTQLHISDVARVLDTHEDEYLRIRLNGNAAVNLSIQKQPSANTVAVVDVVQEQLAWLKQQNLIPEDIMIEPVGDQSVYVRHALNNASTAVIAGAILAMFVVYLFLGNLRRTLIIGTAIPLAIFVTFILMASGELTLNIMTLGGLALGVGMLVDNTIVMLENISRHQRQGEGEDAPINAAKEVNSAIVAATSTNLAAILPFLFVSGLTGLVFKELILTLSAAILASLVVALTLVPALAAKVKSSVSHTNPLHSVTNRLLTDLQSIYIRFLQFLLQRPWLPILILVPALVLATGYLITGKRIMLPSMDEGQISISVSADSGTQFDDMDKTVLKLESLFQSDPDVLSVFTQSGGFVFGRSTFESSNRAGMKVQLRPVSERELSSQDWIDAMQKKINKMGLVGLRVYMRVRGVRGLHLGRGDDDVSIRIQGDDLGVLAQLGDEVVERLQGMKSIRNIEHNYEETQAEIVIELDRERAARLGISAREMGEAVQIALDGRLISEYQEGDRQYNIRLRLPQTGNIGPDELGQTLVGFQQNRPIYLHEVANIRLVLSPVRIQRDNQRRIVEVAASLARDASIGDVLDELDARLADMALPDGYNLYDGGAKEELQEGQNIGYVLLGLALFLVFVVMAVQYESLRNPLIIMLGVPFAVIGVVLGLWSFDIPISMPVWLGLIMLAGIVVNNAIILVEQIEIQREQGTGPLQQSILEAASLRLRPILMTALTTIIGMLPLALGLGEGAEMLKPLALVIVCGLSFSTLVSLIIIPNIYQIINKNT